MQGFWPTYYNQQTGAAIWPPHDGFVGGLPDKSTIRPPMVIDRYGDPRDGFFFSPEGVPFKVRQGEAAPWFGSGGGGGQFSTNNLQVVNPENGIWYEATVENLKRFGYIKEL